MSYLLWLYGSSSQCVFLATPWAPALGDQLDQLKAEGFRLGHLGSFGQQSQGFSSHPLLFRALFTLQRTVLYGMAV